MTLAMMFLRSSVGMVKVCYNGWTLSVLPTVAAEIETADLLQ